MNDTKPFGWDLEVLLSFNNEDPSKIVMWHYRGCSEAGAKAKAKRRAIFTRHVKNYQILTVTPLTKEQWLRAYGIGKM